MEWELKANLCPRSSHDHTVQWMEHILSVLRAINSTNFEFGFKPNPSLMSLEFSILGFGPSESGLDRVWARARIWTELEI